MMTGPVDSMMTGIMGFGWLPVLIAVGLVIAGAVMVASLLRPGEPAHATGDLVLRVLAVVGGIALVALLAMGPHFGMRCCG
jgi:predicted membrane-bound mannosyltransferase